MLSTCAFTVEDLDLGDINCEESFSFFLLFVNRSNITSEVNSKKNWSGSNIALFVITLAPARPIKAVNILVQMSKHALKIIKIMS